MVRLKVFSSLIVALIVYSVSVGQDTTLSPGAWQGTLTFQGVSLRVVFNLSVEKDGTHKGTMDSPDQGAHGIPVDSVIIKSTLVRFRVGAVRGVFEGRRVTGSDSLAGTWKQGGVSVPLGLKYVGTSVEDVRRPQEPVKPYPYAEEEVSFPGVAGGVSIAGTLTIPVVPGSHPAVLLISGSGPQDRDEALFGHRPFLVLADYLTRRGIAVLRCDDRGIGKSSGVFASATTRDFAGDVAAGVKYLRGRKEIDPDRIGLVGHSEGGIIAPMAASESGDVAFIVLLAGTGVTGEEVLLRQAADIASAMGASREQIQSRDSLNRSLFALLKSGNDSAETAKQLGELLRTVMSANAPETDRSSIESMVNLQVGQMMSPWFRFFLTYDPRSALRRVRCPVLAVNGEKDLQVSAGVNLPAIEAALREGGNNDVTVRKLAGLNHLFQTAVKGTIDEYGTIEETFAPSALQVIGDWVVEHGRR